MIAWFNHIVLHDLVYRSKFIKISLALWTKEVQSESNKTPRLWQFFHCGGKGIEKKTLTNREMKVVLWTKFGKFQVFFGNQTLFYFNVTDIFIVCERNRLNYFVVEIFSGLNQLINSKNVPIERSKFPLLNLSEKILSTKENRRENLTSKQCTHNPCCRAIQIYNKKKHLYVLINLILHCSPFTNTKNCISINILFHFFE